MYNYVTLRHMKQIHITTAFEITPPSSRVWNVVPAAFASKTILSRSVTLLFHSVVNVQVTTCPQERFGVVGLCIC